MNTILPWKLLESSGIRVARFMLFGLSFCLVTFGGCTRKASVSSEPDCPTIMNAFEKYFLSGAPVSEGPTAVVEYLMEMPGFELNEGRSNLYSDYEKQKSVRFNSDGAHVYGEMLVNEKSIFLMNYWLPDDDTEVFDLFQAIYFFEEKQAQEKILAKMNRVITNELNSEVLVMYDIEGNPYRRVLMPCGSGFNFKEGEVDGKYILNILWVPDVTK